MAIRSLSVTPSGLRAVTGSEDKTVRIWNMDSGDCLHTLAGHKSMVNSVSVTPDGRIAVSAGWTDKTIRIWHVESGTCLHTLESKTYSNIWNVKVTPDGRIAVSGESDRGGRNAVRVWDIESGERLHKLELEGHKDSIQSISITPDGRRVVTAGGRDKTLRVWDLKSGKCLHKLEGHKKYYGWNSLESVSVTPDGQIAVSAGNEVISRAVTPYIS
jgi:WD40 repeat protein